MFESNPLPEPRETIELPGCAEYASHTKYRLLPEVW